MNVSEIELNDPLWGDFIHSLPDGSFISTPELKKLLSGEGFKIFSGIGEKAKDIPGISNEEFHYYFSSFLYTEKFGLPHGKGWLNELPSTLQFLSKFTDVKLVVEHYLSKKAQGQNEISPENFQG